MEIISLKFAFLAVAAFFVYFLIHPKYRIVFLTILSCGFVASFNYLLILYVITYALVNFYITGKIPDSKHKTALYRAGIIINLSQLILLRYASFTIDPVLHLFNDNIYVSRISELIIPVGISYFTLQGIGYLINVKMGWEKPEKKFIHFLLYIVFFPKFLSGPIERSNHFLPQLNKIQSFDQQRVVDGLKLALFGFFKKVAIANQIAPFLVDTYANVNTVDGSSLLIVWILQPLYLYFDFSGYTDIAIGFAKTFGIEILPNFNRPFFSENMTNFWKRFHISLSSWFNDYIFRQTVFKRRKWGIYASVYALLITWTLFGIWHGAGWNFMLLGLVQALAIIYEFFTKRWRVKVFSKLPEYPIIWFGRICTYLFYGGSLVFFFSPDIKTTSLFYSRLFSIQESIPSIFINTMRAIPLSALILIVVIMFFELLQNDFNETYNTIKLIWTGNQRKKRFLRWVVYSCMLAILFVLGNQVQQFIYAQF